MTPLDSGGPASSSPESGRAAVVDSSGNAPPTATLTPPSVARHVAARFVFWTPVLAALALFAQIAFLGLRPAISEARRLADASDVLELRWLEDRQLYDAYELQLQARQDPIFRERQRRVRLATGPAGG